MSKHLAVVYEDQQVVVIDKPAGLLSQPGKHVHDSVQSRAHLQWRDATGPMLVHRLDMDTSGLMVLGKTRLAHRGLQQQFEHRQILKRYRARLIRAPHALGGMVRLPMRLDLDRRPHQIICSQHGRTAITAWQRLGGLCSDSQSAREVVFYPMTGRTHQLRVHAASPLGLAAPIQGDPLYGDESDDPEQRRSRLMLHADYLGFCHPIDERWINVHQPATFDLENPS